MLGEELAKLIDERVNAEASAASSDHQYKKSYGLIKANNNKAKHLTIASATLHGMSLDLVNLTNESFHSAPADEDASIFGTPLDDVMRRDCTINALFYNINQGKVEDWTGQGISDINARVIRTPLAPLQTFKNSPLCVLRTVRFANRFNFELASGIMEAARDPEVRQLLLTKISHERKHSELDKILSGKQPEVAVAQLHDMAIWELLYQVPEECVEFQAEGALRAAITTSVTHCKVVATIFERLRA